MSSFEHNLMGHSNRRQNSLLQAQSQPKLSNRQAINMIKLLNRYSNPQYSQDLALLLNSQNSNSYYGQNSSSIQSTRSNRKISVQNNKENDPNYVNQRIHLMLEKEILSLKSDLNRLKAYEYEKNKKYEDYYLNMMKEQQKYPPPYFFFGGSQALHQMGQPAFLM
ncbi:hypothetical protein ABPG72_012756 [Tetrahymena utriculariae]